MHIRKLLVLMILGLSLTAAAEFRTTIEVYEINFVNVRLPGTEGGTISIKHCNACEAQLLRVTATTRYVVNGRSVRLADFRRSLTSIRNRDDVDIDVFHDLQSNTVTRVRVNL